MINAKEEFLEVIGTGIKCAHIVYCPNYDTSITIILKVGYTETDWNIFLQNLDFEYDNGFGTQHLFGTVWMTDTLWADRHEYNGSEYWEFFSYPEIPQILL